MKLLIDAWNSGQIILHPTDTIPGLSFNPLNEEAVRQLSIVKGRPESKTCVCLSYSSEAAFDFFSELPLRWQKILTEAWPGALSVVYKASKKCPPTIVRDNGTIAIRVPDLSNQNLWLTDFMKSITTPFPTTSVNRSGEPACLTWENARNFLESTNSFIPAEFSTPGGKPSTLIEITGSQSYRVIREGSYEISKLETIIHECTNATSV